MKFPKNSHVKILVGQLKFKIHPMKLNFYFTGIIFTLIIFFGFFGIVKSSEAANIYVDQTLSANCTSGDYSTTNSTCTGTDGDAYTTVQGAVDGMSGGDNIYLRGGRYYEKWIVIDSSKNGNINNPTIIKSYPGEWAIIDGEHDCFTDSPSLHGYNAAALFILGGGSSYISFEKLELTGGGYTQAFQDGGDGASAIRAWYNVSNIVIKNCYIHDNSAGSGGGNPGGIYAYSPNNWTIKYNYFKDNGCVAGVVAEQNCVGSAIFIGERTFFSGISSMQNNEFAYNLVEGGVTGYNHKHVQYFGEQFYDNSDLVYKDWGDKIHHNIMKPEGSGFKLRQDFFNIYNNIIDLEGAPGCSAGWAAIQVQDYRSTADNDDSKIHNYLIYNNQIHYPIYGGITMATYLDPFSWVYNNIIETNDNFWMNSENREINIQNGLKAGEVDLNNCEIDRNLILNPEDVNHFLLSASPGKVSASDFNSQYDKDNYSVNSGDFWEGSSGAERYFADSNFIIDSTNVAEGGVGGSHPYLDGVMVPSYVGAVNPDDDAWVDGVLALDSTYMTSVTAGSDPSWIEGATSDTTPPSAPSGLGVS